jgi:hypothetical protein
MDGISSLKVKASTLIEVVVAMVIMFITFGLGMMIYHNVLKSGINLQNIKADHLSSQIVEETIKARSYFDEEMELQDLLVKKRIGPYQNNSSLLLLEIQVFSKDAKLLAETSQLILADE